MAAPRRVRDPKIDAPEPPIKPYPRGPVALGVIAYCIFAWVLIFQAVSFGISWLSPEPVHVARQSSAIPEASQIALD